MITLNRNRLPYQVGYATENRRVHIIVIVNPAMIVAGNNVTERGESTANRGGTVYTRTTIIIYYARELSQPHHFREAVSVASNTALM